MEFKQAQSDISALFWDNGNEVRVGSVGVTEIRVSMENGSMAVVPWFEVYRDEKLISKHNGAFVESVVFKS